MAAGEETGFVEPTFPGSNASSDHAGSPAGPYSPVDEEIKAKEALVRADTRHMAPLDAEMTKPRARPCARARVPMHRACYSSQVPACAASYRHGFQLPSNPREDGRKPRLRNRGFRRLEARAPCVANDLGADLDPPRLQGAQRPAADGRPQGSQSGSLPWRSAKAKRGQPVAAPRSRGGTGGRPTAGAGRRGGGRAPQAPTRSLDRAAPGYPL
jgi:hypothetical protein